MIATNIPLFQAMNVMPIKLDLARLDDGGDIEETLRNKQRWKLTLATRHWRPIILFGE